MYWLKPVPFTLLLDFGVIAIPEQLEAPTIGLVACAEGADADMDEIVGLAMWGHGVAVLAQRIGEHKGVFNVRHRGNLYPQNSCRQRGRRAHLLLNLRLCLRLGWAVGGMRWICGRGHRCYGGQCRPHLWLCCCRRWAFSRRDRDSNGRGL